MLVLNRKVGEEIVIGNREVVIQILAQNSNSIKLGFNASRHIPIDRAEIHKRKSGNHQEKKYVR